MVTIKIEIGFDKAGENTKKEFDIRKAACAMLLFAIKLLTFRYYFGLIISGAFNSQIKDGGKKWAAFLV